MPSELITSRIIQLQQSIAHELQQCNRTQDHVQIIAVSKHATAEQIQAAFNAGITNFGESYLQSALQKQIILQSQPLVWHFIGPIQSNKTAKIAQNFTWVHSLDREIIAEQLNKFRPSDLPPLQVCIQVNLDLEQTKSGVDVSEIANLAQYISRLPKLKLRGLMCIPKLSENIQQQEKTFHRLKKCLIKLNIDENYKLDTLSMGMSDDYLAALRSGSTMLRIGKLIFKE
jgi:PLP dependent protein